MRNWNDMISRQLSYLAAAHASMIKLFAQCFPLFFRVGSRNSEQPHLSSNRAFIGFSFVPAIGISPVLSYRFWRARMRFSPLLPSTVCLIWILLSPIRRLYAIGLSNVFWISSSVVPDCFGMSSRISFLPSFSSSPNAIWIGFLPVLYLLLLPLRTRGLLFWSQPAISRDVGTGLFKSGNLFGSLANLFSVVLAVLGFSPRGRFILFHGVPSSNAFLVDRRGSSAGSSLFFGLGNYASPIPTIF